MTAKEALYICFSIMCVEAVGIGSLCFFLLGRN